MTLRTDGDNSLMGSLPNGVNNKSIDLPDSTGGSLNLNHNPRNGLEYFNTSLFSPNALGTPGNASRRSTVLTLDMAYNNARLLARPDNEWLQP